MPQTRSCGLGFGLFEGWTKLSEAEPATDTSCDAFFKDDDDETEPGLACKHGKGESPTKAASLFAQGLPADESPWYQHMGAEPVFFSIVICCAAWEGMNDLCKLAVAFFFKDDLKLHPSQSQTMLGIVMLPWVTKPLWGFVTDSWPVFGLRRKFYLVSSGVVAMVAWVTLGLFAKTPHHALACLLTQSVATAFVNVISKALVVEHASGRSQQYGSWLLSLHFSVRSSAAVFSAYFGGFLLELVTPRELFLIQGCIPSIVVISSLLLREDPVTQVTSMRARAGELWRVITLPQKALGGTIKLWQPMLFIFLFAATPTYSSATFYFFTGPLKLSPEFMGRVATVGNIFTLIGMFTYQRFLSHASFRTTMIWGITLGSLISLFMLLLVTGANVKLGIPSGVFLLGDEAISDAIGTISYFPVLVMAARAGCGPHSALSFCMLISIPGLLMMPEVLLDSSHQGSPETPSATTATATTLVTTTEGEPENSAQPTDFTVSTVVPWEPEDDSGTDRE
eukprot:g72819.t1